MYERVCHRQNWLLAKLLAKRREFQNWTTSILHEGGDGSGRGSGMLWAVSQAAPLRRVIVDCDLKLWYLRLASKGISEGSAEYAFQGVIWSYQQFKDNDFLNGYDCPGDYASGGYMANVTVNGSVELNSQQQFFQRNCTVRDEIKSGVWNNVFVDCKGEIPGSVHEGDMAPPVVNTIIDTTLKATHQKVMAEKPFIMCDEGDQFWLVVPKAKVSQQGAHYNIDDSEIRSFENVFLALPEHSAEQINRKLAAGRDILFTPGIYTLSETLHVCRDGQVLLGIGYATLVSPIDKPGIIVDTGAVGVRISGFMLEAPYQPLKNGRIPQEVQGPSALLQWGQDAMSDPPVRDHNRLDQYSFLHDCFGRVGGQEEPYTVSRTGERPTEPTEACCETMVQINVPCVVGDHFWLWRADHWKSDHGLSYNHENHCQKGLHISANASHVTMYGLFVEHTLGDMYFCEAQHSTTYFYQSELPYDALDEAALQTFAEERKRGPKALTPYEGSGYRVGPLVTDHEAHGVGVYCFFRDHNISVPAAVVAPSGSGIKIRNAFTVYLNGGPVPLNGGQSQGQYGKIECVVQKGDERHGSTSDPSTAGKGVFVPNC